MGWERRGEEGRGEEGGGGGEGGIEIQHINTVHEILMHILLFFGFFRRRRAHSINGQFKTEWYFMFLIIPSRL